MWTFILVTLLFIFYLIYYFITSKFKYFIEKRIPGPKPSFPFGNTPSFITQSRNITYEIDDIYQEFKGKAPFAGYFEIKTPKILLIDPEAVRTVLIKNFKNFHDNEFSKLTDKEKDPMFGRNPFMLRGEEWKEKRAEITPAFTPSRIKALFPLVENVSKQLVNYVKENTGKDFKHPFDAREVSAKFTTDVVSNCIFGIDAKSFTQENPEIREMGRKIMETSPFLMIVFMMYSFIPSLTKVYKIKMVSEEIELFFTRLMSDAIQHRDLNNIKRNDYLAYLIELREKKNISPLDMAAHGVTFFIDGFETSSIAISCCLYELGANINVQEKLRKELENVYDKDGKLNHDNLIENLYLDQVFHEALRLHPAATIINRECNESIDIDGFTIEEGTGVNIPIYSIHRDPEHYSNPEKFYPERFDPENGGVKAFTDKCVLLPFGDGPRKCLGMRFALMQSKVAIAEIVRNFDISVDGKTKLPLEIDPKQFLNLKTGGLWLNFKSIN